MMKALHEHMETRGHEVFAVLSNFNLEIPTVDFTLRPGDCLTQAAALLAMARPGTTIFVCMRGRYGTGWRAVSDGSSPLEPLQNTDDAPAVGRTAARLRSIGVEP